jgi:hypothetical protein
MVSSLGGKMEDEVRARVTAASPSFVGVKHYLNAGDLILCDAPDIIGQILVVRAEIRERNLRTDISEKERDNNLLMLNLLHLYLKLQISECVSDAQYVHTVNVCMEGKIYVPKRHVRRNAA